VKLNRTGQRADARGMRAVLAMRLIVYGLTALLVVGILAMRASHDSRSRGSVSALYHGQTPEGLLVALSVTDGKVREAYLRWHMTCQRADAPDISTITFKPQYGDRFRQTGRRFSAGGSKVQDAGGGEKIRYDVQVSGQLSEDLRSASGSGQTTQTWTRNGFVTDVCHSQRVPWTVHRGKVFGG
jgi:hypothetical protein